MACPKRFNRGSSEPARLGGFFVEYEVFGLTVLSLNRLQPSNVDTRPLAGVAWNHYQFKR